MPKRLNILKSALHHTIQRCLYVPLPGRHMCQLWYLHQWPQRPWWTVFLPCCMHCMHRALATRRLSVRLSVCLSLCQTHALWQNGTKICPDFYIYERPFTLVFREKEWLVGATPSAWNFGSSWLCWSEIDEFRFLTFLRGSNLTPQTRLCSHQWGVVIDQWGVKPPTPRQIEHWIGCQLLLITNRKSLTVFPLVSTSVSLNDLERHNTPYFALFTEFDSFAGLLYHNGWRQSYIVCRILSFTFGRNWPTLQHELLCYSWATCNNNNNNNI